MGTCIRVLAVLFPLGQLRRVEMSSRALETPCPRAHWIKTAGWPCLRIWFLLFVLSAVIASCGFFYAQPETGYGFGVMALLCMSMALKLAAVISEVELQANKS